MMYLILFIGWMMDLYGGGTCAVLILCSWLCGYDNKKLDTTKEVVK